jgi:prevent-host-death family protein
VIQYGHLEVTILPSITRKSIDKTDTRGNTVSIAEAKANLSSIVKSVQKKRTAITILRRGVPVATITPIASTEPTSLYGSMRGTVQELGDIVGPTGVEWAAGDE